MIKAIEPLGKHDRAAFSYGMAALDDWFRLRSGQDEKNAMRRVLDLGSCVLHRRWVTCNLPQEVSMPSSSRRRAASKRFSSRDKVRAHRKRLRARGLRPVQFWLPDTRTAAFKAEAHRQSQAVARSSYATRDQDFIDAISIHPGD
jgi:hypothetical protein